MKKIKFMDTSFRDGFQSYFGARVLTEDFIPAVEAAAAAGIDHFEAGGGARFQSLFLYCNSSAFDMMDKFRAAAGPNAKLQTLARGINVVALSSQPKDMIELHAKMFAKHGISHIRNFDSLNDIRNLEWSGQCIKNAGLHHQVTVTMMELPPGCEGAHDADFYVGKVKEIMKSGLPFDSICFKDASGTSNPRKVYETIKKTRELVGKDITLWIHSHATAGVGEIQYKAAIEADVDGICVARKPISGGTAQPDLLTMNHVLKGSDYTLDIDYKKILEANAVFKDCLKDYFFPPEALAISPEVIFSPMPGGALTANTMMMRDTGTLHLFPQVIEAMSEVVKKGGFGTSVTPTSQFYFQQAFANVTQGPWKKITEGYGKTILGYFGRTPVKPDADIIKIAEEQLGMPFYAGDPLDKLEPGIPKATEMLKKEGLAVNDENIFIAGALNTPGGNKGIEFLKGNGKVSVRKESAEDKAAAAAPKKAAKASGGAENYTVTVDGKSYNVTVAEGSDVITSVTPAKSAPAAKAAAAPAAGGGSVEITAKLPGNVLKVGVASGDKVNEGDTIVILEAMKMETPVLAPQSGTISSVEVAQGDVVKASQLLVTMN